MAALVPFVSASRPESTWKGAPKFAWPTKLKSTALRVADASGGAAVCAMATAVDQSRAQVKPRQPTRIAADARFILEAPFIRRLQTQVARATKINDRDARLLLSKDLL